MKQLHMFDKGLAVGVRVAYKPLTCVGVITAVVMHQRKDETEPRPHYRVTWDEGVKSGPLAPEDLEIVQ
jgi:hypothetical protein